VPHIITPAQCAQLAANAGVSGDNLVIAVAIAMAESGLDTTIVSAPNTNGTTDYGLWQVNSVHSEYDTAKLIASDGVYNAAAMFTLSSKGTVWQPWSTYNNGAYLANMTAARGAVVGIKPGGGGGGGGTGPKAWYCYPRIDGLGGVEPFGNYPKPDSNIQIPAGYLVTSLLDGVITDIDHGSPWSCVVTCHLDKAINSLATSIAYIHLRADVAVRIGQHVKIGDTIGYNGFAQAEGSEKVPLGIALYHGDSYGKGAGWADMTKANLQGPLNPVPLIVAACKDDPFNNPLLGGSGGVADYGGKKAPEAFLQQLHDTLVKTPGFYGLALAIDEAEQFVGYVDVTNKQPDFAVPIPLTGASFDTGVAPPDVIGMVRSIGLTITMNFYPFAFRSIIFSLGFFLLIALITKPLSAMGGQAAQFIAANPEIVAA
jgi:Lysozyme like domain